MKTQSGVQLKSSLFVILFTVFLDAVGVGLVYPIASPLFLDRSPQAFLPFDASTAYRGMLLGLLMASFTIGQFLFSPIFGSYSDSKGRKKIVLATLVLSALSYALGALSIEGRVLIGIFLSRFLAGAAAGNSAVMQASMADLSQPHEKAKRFGLLGASFGVGFITGPFLGGILSNPQLGFGFGTPFWAASLLAAGNLLVAYFLFGETKAVKSHVPVNWCASLFYLKRAFEMKPLRALFSVMFLYFFGWELFIVFGPVYLIHKFAFNAVQIGNFYAYVGLWFVISNGLFMRFIARYEAEKVLQLAFPLWGVSLYCLSLVNDVHLFWWALAPVPGIGAIIFSMGSALASNRSEKEMQGETLGVYQSVQAAALAFPPLCVGSLVTVYPSLPLFGGAACLFLATFVWWQQKKIPRSENS